VIVGVFPSQAGGSCINPGMNRTILALALAAATSGACTDEQTLGTDESLVFNGNGDECPKLGCSSNSAYRDCT